MDGRVFEPRIRRFLKDVENANRLGTFWSIYDIESTLNLAQDVFLKYCIYGGKLHLLDHLITQTPQVNSSPTTLPFYPVFLYPISAVTIDEEVVRQARIYFADGIPFLNTGCDGCFILGNTIIYTTKDPIRGGSKYVGGELTYYRYPDKIYLQDPQPPERMEFDQYVYDYFIVPYSTIILGMKELHTQREIKTYRNFVTDFFAIPQDYANFVRDYEFTGNKIPVGKPETPEASK